MSSVISNVQETLEKKISEDFFSLYRHMLTTRLVEQKMEKLVRQNKGGSFHLPSKGHELAGCLFGYLLKAKKDWALPYYRDRGFAVSFGCSLKTLFGAFLARDTLLHSSGRMMPEHYCDPAMRILPQSSVVGSQMHHAVGVALSAKLQSLDEIVYVSIGDGATSQGDFHEALNYSSIKKLPVLFSVQDNGYAISVTSNEQTAGGSVEALTSAYPGIKVISVDGCDILTSLKGAHEAISYLRKQQGPVVFISKVARLGAHSSSDDPQKYKEKSEIELERQNRDPIKSTHDLLLSLGTSEERLHDLYTEQKRTVEEAAKEAETINQPDVETVLDHVYAPSLVENHTHQMDKSGDPIVMVDALNHALKEEMKLNDKVIVFGQDVAKGKGGVFGVTADLTDLFQERCQNTPLAESLIVGMAAGLALSGRYTPVAEIQFADYIWTGINQLFNEVATMHYRSNGLFNVPLVLRMPSGGYIQGGPYHSQSIEGYLMHCPGLKVVYPSNAYDAKCLLKASIRDPNPVIFLEHKGLYRQRAFSARQEPKEDEILQIGQAHVVQEGSDLTIVTYGMMVGFTHEVVQSLKKQMHKKVDIEIIDLRTIAPIDFETIIQSVKKTNRLLIVHEAIKEGGVGGEIAARVAEDAFEYLDAPIYRIGALKTPVSYNKELELAQLPSKDMIAKAINTLMEY